MRTTKESIRLPITCPVIGQTKRSPEGDLVCEAARDGLIIGRMDWHRPLLFINAANYSGLKHAAQLAAITGHNEEAAAWKHEADTLQQAWINAFDKESGNERTYICSLWPDWIGQPIQSKFAAKALSNWQQLHDSTGDYKALPLWTYFDFASAHQWLFMQQPEYTWKTLEWFWQHQCSPGLYSWWEGNGEENSSGRWDNVRGWVKPKHVTPHYWTAAMALALQLDMLAFLDDHGPEPVVVIGEGVKPEWLSQPMKVEGIRLHGNTINWQWDGKTLHVSMRGTKMKIRAGSPFGKNAKMDIEYIN